MAVEGGEVAVDRGGGCGGTEVSVEEVEVAEECGGELVVERWRGGGGGGGLWWGAQQDTSLRAPIPDLQS